MKIINLLPKSLSRELQLELIAGQILNFWTWLLFSIAIFFTLVLASVFYIRTEIQRVDNQIVEQIETLSASNTKELEAKVSALNTRIRNVKNIREQHYYWSKGLTEIANIIPPEMRIEVFAADRDTGKIEMAGSSDTRDAVLEFWSNVNKSGYFTNINFPLRNLEKETDASYSFTFYLKPEMIKE